MPYSADSPPRWAAKKSKAVRRVASEVYNSTLKDTGDETKAMRASQAAMVKAEESFSKKKTKKSLITKSLNEEKRLATFVVLEPQPEDGTTTDLHGDYYNEETILKACLDFNKNIHLRKGKLLHMVETQGYSFVESYCTPAEMSIGDIIIKKGTWLQTIQVNPDEKFNWIWDGIKNGTFNGLSVECMGVTEDIE